MASQKQTRPRSGSGVRTGQGRSGQGRGTGQTRSGGQNRQTGKDAGRGQNRGGGQSRAATASSGRASQELTDQQVKAAQASPYAAPLWLQITTLVLSLCGLGLSIYLTIAHLTTASLLACSDKGFINCAAVTTSAESKLFGFFPVSELGLAFFVFMVVVNSPWGWRSRWPAIYWARLGAVIVGMVMVLWLLFAELVLIKNLCLFCTGVHICTFLLFALIVYHASGQSARAAAAQPVRQRG